MIYPLYYKAPELTPAQAEVYKWIKDYKEVLKGRDRMEVAHLAIMNGFNPDAVFATVLSFRCAMTGNRIENIAYEQVWLIDQTMNRVQKMRKKLELGVLDLSEQWEELVAYTITGEDCDE